MHACSRWIGLLAILASAVLMLPLLADDAKDVQEKKDAELKKDEPKKDAVKEGEPKDDKKKKDDKAEAKPPEEKVVWGSEVAGKLKQMDANSQKDFTVQLTFKIKEPNLDAQRQLLQQQQQLAQQQFNLKRARSIDEVRNANLQIAQTLNSIRQTQSNLFRYKELSKDLDVRAADNVKVRSLYPPVVYDDKGQLKAWNAKDLAALRAGSKLPGYPAEYEVLRPGQMVRVYLAKQATPKAKKKFDDEDDLGPGRPEVVMILVEREAAPQK
jgi:hypothetical protein